MGWTCRTEREEKVIKREGWRCRAGREERVIERMGRREWEWREIGRVGSGGLGQKGRKK